MKKEALDKILTKLISRKLMAFIVACAGLFSGKLDGDNWVIITAVYIGAEMVTGTVERLMKAKVFVPKHEETEKG